MLGAFIYTMSKTTDLEAKKLEFLLLTSYVTLGKSFNLPSLSFPICIMGIPECDIWDSFFIMCHHVSPLPRMFMMFFGPHHSGTLSDLDSWRVGQSAASVHLPLNIQPQQFIWCCHIFIKTKVSHCQIRNSWVDINLKKGFLSPRRPLILQQDVCLIPLQFYLICGFQWTEENGGCDLGILSDFVHLCILFFFFLLPSLDK